MSKSSPKSCTPPRGNRLPASHRAKGLESSLEIYRNQPSSAKKANSRIPEPQFQRILQRHVSGESIREISRAEHRSRECVTRVVKSDEIQGLVIRMRAEVYGLADDAIRAVRHSLQQQKDGRIGYRLLMDIGAIPPPGEAEANSFQARQPDPEELTLFERVAAQDEWGQINPWQLALVQIGESNDAMFGSSSLLPTADELLRKRTYIALINEMTGGQSSHLSNYNQIEWNRLKVLAEDVLQGKRSINDKEILAVRKKYSD